MTVAEDDRAGAGPSPRRPRPRVFVAYAADSRRHEDDVLRLCHLLVRNGLDVRLDKWSLGERRAWGEWTTAEIKAADYVLAVASSAFRRAGDGDAGVDEHRGAQAETALLRELLQQDRPTWRRRILPVLLPGGSWTDIPVFLSPWNDTRFEVSAFTVDGANALIRFLTRQPEYVPPEPGDPPYLPPHQVDTRLAGAPAVPFGSGSADQAFAPDPGTRIGAGRVPAGSSSATVRGSAPQDGAGPLRPAGRAGHRWPLVLLLALAVVAVGAAATSPLRHRPQSPPTSGTGPEVSDTGSSTGSPPAPRSNTRRLTLKVSNNPLTSDKDKIDLDTGCPGHGSQPQVINHCGRLADLVLDPERLHTVDDDPRLLLVSSDAGTTDCRRALNRPARPLAGSIDLGELTVGTAICLRTDEDAIGYVAVVDRNLSYPTTLVIDWAVQQAGQPPPSSWAGRSALSAPRRAGGGTRPNPRIGTNNSW